MVVTTVKLTMAPVLERLAVAEAKAAQVSVLEKAVSDLREGLMALQLKADPVMPPAVDLAPLCERVAVVETKVAQAMAEQPIAAIRDRVVALETKAEIVAAAPAREPQTVDLSPVLSPVLSQIDDIRSRLIECEVKSVPVVNITPLESRIAALEFKVDAKSAESSQLTDLMNKVSDIQTKVAVLEVRQPMPGPAGPSGKDGLNGRDGKDGVDGLGFDDLIAEQNDDRSVTVKAVKGDRIKDIGTARFPVEIYRGVFVTGKTYERGDCVTFGGSEFHCNETTTAKPEESKSWTLKVKRGRDGRDGKDAPTIPVVSVSSRGTN